MKKKGFTLIELMIVLAIIAITATLVISNLASSRKAGNETSAIKGIRAGVEACGVYKKLGISGDTDGDNNGQEYPNGLALMVDAQGNDLVPYVTTNPYHGYTYDEGLIPGFFEEGAVVEAGPGVLNVDGDRDFASSTVTGICWGAAGAGAAPPGFIAGWTLPETNPPFAGALPVQE